jgi:toxin ParE1/3/4
MAAARPLIWSRPARDDLREIWIFSAESVGPDRADDHVRRIATACQLLIATPLAGRSRDELRPGFRSIVIRPHIVFYRAMPISVEIVRILHAGPDIQALFGAPED